MAQVDESIFLFKSDPTKGKVHFFSTDKNRSMMKHFYVVQHSTHSKIQIMKFQESGREINKPEKLSAFKRELRASIINYLGTLRKARNVKEP